MNKLLACITMVVTSLPLSIETPQLPPFLGRKWKSTYGPSQYDRDKRIDWSMGFEYSKYVINKQKRWPMVYGYSKYGSFKPQYSPLGAMHKTIKPSIYDFGKQINGGKTYGNSKYELYKRVKQMKYDRNGPYKNGPSKHNTERYQPPKYGPYAHLSQPMMARYPNYYRDTITNSYSPTKVDPSGHARYSPVSYRPMVDYRAEYPPDHNTIQLMPMTSPDYHGNANERDLGKNVYNEASPLASNHPPSIVSDFFRDIPPPSKSHGLPKVEVVANIPSDKGTDLRIWEVKQIDEPLPFTDKHTSNAVSPEIIVNSNIPEVTPRIPSFPEVTENAIHFKSSRRRENADFADVGIASLNINVHIPDPGPYDLCVLPNKVICGARLPWSEVDGMDDWCENNCGEENFLRYCDDFRCTCRCDSGDSVLWTYYKGS